MKKLLYILFLIPLLSFGQQIPISNSTATVCAGTFVDTGGAAANYNNNQNITFTICPATAGDVTRVNFSFFETELNNDVLSVFEGATNNPAFLIGTYSGTNSPGNILGDLAIDGGCLTFNFISNVVLNSPGWEAAISCTPPCQTVNAIFDSADPPVDPVENVILACPNESITFNGSGTFSNPGGDVGATYEWFFSDATSLVGQTVLKTFTAGGFYEADLVVTDSFGCESTNDIGVFLQIGTEPDFTGTAAEMDPICLGDSVVITGMVEPVPFEVNCTIPVAEITFLPDDNGTTFYETCIPVDCFNAGETVQNASDILEICLNLEHSYLGDLDIFIIAPDGNQVTLKSFGAGGGGTFLGSPIEPDTDLTAGTGFDYCFGAAGTVTLVNGPQVAVDSGPPSNTTGNAIAAGNYLPEQDFSALIGSPLNGDWCIRVVDNLSSDNGYIFSWLLNFDPDIIPADAAFEPVITSEAWDPDPTTLNVVGNSILVQPTVVGQKCYTYRVMDDFGCEHTQEVCIDVLPTPIANEPNDLLICDDGTSAGTFNLSQNDAVVLGAQNPADFVISYYNSQADADAGMPAIAGSGAYGITGTSEFIFIRIEDASGLCYETAEFEIQFLPIDIVNPITDLLLCDADADGFVLVNIPQQKDTEILNGQDPNDYTLTYHNTIGDANADMNALPVPYNATAPGQVVFVRIENNTQNIGTCFLVDSFDLGIFQAPPANQPTLFAICDEVPNDGLAVFNLTTKDAEITGGNPDAEVFYFETLLNAQTNMVPINPANNYQNTIAGFQTLFARVQNINNAACFNIVTLDLQVDVAPIIADPITDFFQCDNDEDFVETFDLTLKDDEIENGLVDVFTTYYDTLADAETGMNSIPNPTAYTSGSNEIFVVVENNLGCQTIGSFILILGVVPEYDVPLPFEQCDFESDGIEFFDLNESNEQIVNGAIGLSVTYFGNMMDAENATNPLTLPYQSMGAETVWVRIEDDITGCYGVEIMELILVPLPAICEPDPLVYCDTDNDGIGEFILTERESQIRCGDPSGNLEVTFYETQADANNAANPILDVPYLNIVPFSQIVFARISDLATGCYDTVAFELIVGDSPVINAPDPILLCDDDGDGIEIFDLTSAASQILAGLTGGPYVVEYFETQPNADSGTNPIVNEMVYPNQPSLGSPQIIYIVVTDTTNGCSSQTTLELQVNFMPAITAPDPLILCETSTPPDGIESFDLTQVIAQITGGDTNILITFFETQIDADANANVIADPTAFENQISNPQDVFIRAEDLTTSCIETSFTLEIRVENAPSPATPDPLVVCDDNNDGFALFDLTDAAVEIIDGEPNVVLSYYETPIDAFNATFPIDETVLYENLIQTMQTVYVRVEYITATDDGCFTIIELDLIVIDSPVVPLSLDDLIACDDEDMDGFSIFDLTQQNITIYGDQDPDDFTLTYHLAEMDALDGAPIIASPTMYENTSNPQTIWYRLDNNDADNFCSATGSFMLQVVDGPEIIDLDPITVCDDLGQENDGITIFDLTIYDDLIANGVAGLSVQYFLTPEGSQANEDPISPANEHMNVDDMGNAINPQNIFVRVLDTNSGCVGFTILELRVAPNPDPITDVTLELCDDTNSGDEEEIFDLTEAEALIIGGAPWDVQYFETYEDAFDMMNGIPDPTMYINPTNPASIFVLVTNNDTGCFEIVAVQLIVNPLPDDTAVLTSLVVCETPNDGVAEFDLTLKKDEALGPDQDPADFEVSYYETALDAEMMVNPITPANMYPATIIPGMPLLIYTGITNLETGCYIGGVQFFELETRDGATATTPAEPYTLCDTEGANDGFTVFDLSTLDDEILGVQDPTIYGVLYYETLENALEGIDPITPKTSYTNIINPQEIYATLTNALSECSETVVVILNVEQLPFFELPETFRLCVDENGNPIQEDSGEESPPTFGIDLDENLYVFEWTLDGAVLEGEIGNTITAVAGGVYQVTATEIATGCSATAMTTVTLSAPPINFSARLVDGAFSGSNTVEVVTEGIGTYEYSIGDGPFQESAIFENVVAGSQMITIRDVNGCGEATFKFGVIDYDRFMTPNGDGFNDTWNIESIASFDLTANIYIFDRFGKLLKQLSPLNDLGWDGTYNGAAMPSSDYWFLIEYTEDDTRKEFRSHFTLKR